LNSTISSFQGGLSEFRFDNCRLNLAAYEVSVSV